MGNGRFSKLPSGVRNISNKTIGKKINTTFADLVSNGKADYDTLNANYLNKVNPHSDDWRNPNLHVPYRWYRENCQRVCYAVDLQLSGYDVEALPNKVNDGAGGMYGANSYRKVYENAKWDDFRAGTTNAYLKHIESLIPNSGDKCIIGCYWNGGGGHLFNAVNINGKVYGIDGQVRSPSGQISGHLFELSKYTQDFRLHSNMDVLVTSDMSYQTTDLINKFVKRRKSK